MQVVKYSKNGDQGPWLPMRRYGNGWAVPYEEDDRLVGSFSFRVFDLALPKVGDRFDVKISHEGVLSYLLCQEFDNKALYGPYKSYLVLVTSRPRVGAEADAIRYDIYKEAGLLREFAKAHQIIEANPNGSN